MAYSIHRLQCKLLKVLGCPSAPNFLELESLLCSCSYWKILSHSSSGKPTCVPHSWRPSLFLYPNSSSSYSYTESNKAPYLPLDDTAGKGISSLFSILPTTEATDFPHRWLCTCARTKLLYLIKFHKTANLRETQMRAYANLQRRTTETVRDTGTKHGSFIRWRVANFFAMGPNRFSKIRR